MVVVRTKCSKRRCKCFALFPFFVARSLAIPTFMASSQKITSPVLFMVFNRPEPTARVFETIKKARPPRLYIAADGPRASHETDQELCLMTRAVTDDVDWECEVKTLFRDTNLGCKRAVDSAIDWFFEHEEAGIILEDDCLASASFYTYCTELLAKYRDDSRVMVISGVNLNPHSPKIAETYYFSKIMRIWGWATWRRAWQLHDKEMKSFPDFLEKKQYQDLFEDPNIALYWVKCWLSTYLGEIDTWDYDWMYTFLIKGGICIKPSVNLVSNIGFGEDSTHTSNPNSKSANLPLHELGKIEHPTAVICNEEADLQEYEHALRIYPAKDKCSIRYRLKRIRKRRKYRKQIQRGRRKMKL